MKNSSCRYCLSKFPTKEVCNSELEIMGDDQDFTGSYLSSTKLVTWRVRNFSSLPRDVGYALDSPPFDFQNATWCFRLYPVCEILPDCNRKLTIVRLSSRVPHHKLQCILKWSPFDESAVSRITDFDEDRKEMEEVHIFCPTSLDESETMVVIGHVSYRGSRSVDGFSQTANSTPDLKDVGALCHDLKKMLLNGQNHDVILKVKDREFRAHRDLLRARSPVFESMLSHDTIEKNSGVVDIPDCDPSAFEQFLTYLYSEGVETLDAGNMLSLYYVADKYDAGRLKEKCREFIKKSLSTSNITDVVQLALDHSDAILLRWATGYFVREIDEILPTVGWVFFMKRNTIQANELMIQARKRTTDAIKAASKTLCEFCVRRKLSDI